MVFHPFYLESFVHYVLIGSSNIFKNFAVFPASESGTAWEENRAQSRMVRRAKRHNLRELVEVLIGRYFKDCLLLLAPLIFKRIVTDLLP